MSSRSESPRSPSPDHLEDDDNPSTDTSGSESEVSPVRFYNRKKRPSEKVCPFANAQRTNPCPNYDRPRARKDAIMKHLLKVQRKGGDSHHPIDDPLWDSFAVKWFLAPKPPKLEPSTKKTAKQASQSRYYKKRKRIQDEKHDSMERLFNEGKIDEEEFKKILVGEKRRLFITTRRLQGDFDARLEKEVERRVREELAEKLQELTSRLNTNEQHSLAATADAASIQTLQAAQIELDNSREQLNHFQGLLVQKLEDLVQFYASHDFLPSENSILEHHGFQWPSQVSTGSFYAFAAMLVPPALWNKGDLRSASSIRHMAFRLAEHIRLEKDNVEESEQADFEGISATFNSCCDLVTEEESKTRSMSPAGQQAWVLEQDRLWDEAKTRLHLRFPVFNSHAPIQQMKIVDDLADLWRMHTTAEQENATAIQRAKDAVSGA